MIEWVSVPSQNGHPVSLKQAVRDQISLRDAAATDGPTVRALPSLCLGAARATGGNLLRDVLDAERRAGTRVVLSGEHWTACVPAAARWPVEVHLAPHRDVLDLAGLDDAERDELSHVYLELLRRAALPNPCRRNGCRSGVSTTPGRMRSQ